MSALSDTEKRDLHFLRLLQEALIKLEVFHERGKDYDTLATVNRVRGTLDERTLTIRREVERWGRDQGRILGSGFFPDARAWRLDLGDGLVAEVDEIGERLDVRHPLVGNMKIEGRLTPRRVRAHLRKVSREAESRADAARGSEHTARCKEFRAKYAAEGRPVGGEDDCPDADCSWAK